MQKKTILTKILAVMGCVLAWLPLAAPVFFSVAHLAQGGPFHFDYLMPAELFPAALLGGLLLLVVSLRMHQHVRVIAWGLGSMLALLVGSQALAVVSGLASGRIDASGPWFVLVLTMLGGYILALVVVAVTGIRLARGLFARPAAEGGL